MEYTEFTDAFTNWTNVTEITHCHSIYSSLNTGFCPPILKVLEPLSENIRFSNFYHM